MIVLSHTLALSLADSIDARLPVMLWHSVLTRTSVSADQEAIGYPASNLVNPSTYERWVGTDTSDQYVTFDINGVEVDAIGLARHNLGSGGMILSVEAHDGDEDWYELIAEFMPADDNTLLLRFESVYPSQIRLRIQPDDVVPTIAVAYVGKLTAFQRGITGPHTPLTLGRNTEVINGISESGNALGRIITRQSNETDVQIDHIEEDWFYANFEPFLGAGVGTYFFFAWYPEDRPMDIGYCWLRGDVKPSQSPGTLRFSVSMPIGGVVR